MYDKKENWWCVLFEKPFHARTHGLAINFHTYPSPLQVQRADFEVEWACAEYGGLELASIALLTKVLRIVSECSNTAWKKADISKNVGTQ